MPDLHAQLAAVRAAHPLQRITIAGHTWPYLEAGRGGDILLLLPGAMGEADTSFEYILAFRDHYRVLSLSYPATIATLAPLVEGLAQTLAALQAPHAHVVGGSYSGLVAQYFAASHPMRVSSLLLSNIGAPDPTYARRWRVAAHALAPLPESLVHAVMRATIRRFLPADPSGSDSTAGIPSTNRFWRAYFAATIPNLRKQAMLARLRLSTEMHASVANLHRSSYRGPVLIVEADQDALVPFRQRAALCTLYPHACRVAIANKGHVASLDAATTYIAIYQEFLCRHAG
jgi:pimeloyl-ACP methyl ester carboxylesterase